MADTASPAKAEPSKKSKADFMAGARDRLNIAIEAMSQNRQWQVDDLRFAAGSPDNKTQWDAQVLAKRQNDPNGPRPCLTINRLPQHVFQITNEQRQNRPSIKVLPVDGNADKEVADILNGIVRHIEYNSDADVAYSTAGEGQTQVGEGFIRVLTDYVDEMSFEQDILICQVKNPFSVYLDPIGLQRDATGRYCDWGFVVDDLSETEFKRKYPDAEPINWELVGSGNEWKAWFPDSKTVRIAEYFYAEYKSERICMYEDGSVVLASDEMAKKRFALAMIKKIDERPTQLKTWKWCKLNGQEELERQDWAGKYIPIVRIIGNEWMIDGKLQTAGIVRNAKDAQRMFNYWKHLALDTRIPTPNGWTTMGDVRVGDKVIGADGKPCNVIGTSPVHVHKACYRVTFCDGSSIVASDEHNWKVEDRSGRNAKGLIWKEMVIPTVELLPGKHFIRSTAPVDLPEMDLPIHPYLLGLWLGDGHTAEPRITAGTIDAEEIRGNLTNLGYTLGKNTIQHGANAVCFSVLGERKKFTALGLLGNKHIPPQYLRASRQQRESLLQGMMDSDGSITAMTKQCSYTTTLPAIASGFAEIVRSLGIKAVSIERKRSVVVNGESRDRALAIQFSFSAGVEDQVFRLTRKRKHLFGNKHWRRTKRHGITSVERVASVPVKCIGIDNESHLFLAGDSMIPTHNSTETEMLALAPKAPFVGPAEAFDGFEDDWQQANTKNLAYLKYNQFGENGERLDKPQREQPPMPPVGIVNAALGAADDIKSATGQYDPSLGNNPQAKSGVALAREQRKTDIGTFQYQDNQARGIRQLGRIIIDLAPKIYDTRRVIRIMGEDGEPDHVTIDPAQQQPMMEVPNEAGGVDKIYNIGIGTYDVRASVGPSYTSKRQEAAEFMAQVLQGNKELMAVMGDLYFEMLDVPGADKIAERLKRALPPGLAEPEEGEEEPPPMVMTPQGPIPLEAAAQMIAQMQQQLEQAAQAVKDAGDAEELLGAAEKKAVEVKAREDMFGMREQLAVKTLEAEAAREEADRTKIIADMKMMVNDAVNKLEKMKVVDAANADAAQSEEEAQKAQVERADAEAKNAQLGEMQDQLVAQLSEAIKLLAAPRKTTMTVDGETYESTSEPMTPGASA